MVSIVQKIHKSNSVSRNVFDVSNNVDFVTCAGMLLPVRCDEVMPNSEYRFSQSYFLRTLPLVVPSFGRMKVHFDNFFVPYRLLGTDVQDIIVGNNRGMVSNYNSAGTFTNSNKSLPYIANAQLSRIMNSAFEGLETTDAAGYNSRVTGTILLNALGYGVPSVGSRSPHAVGSAIGPLVSGNGVASDVANTLVSTTLAGLDGDSGMTSNNLAMSILPLLSYQKIYQDYYRNKLWESENRASYFIQSADYGNAIPFTTLFSRGIAEMRYHDFDKDRITGMVPDVSNLLATGLNVAQVFGSQSTGLDNANVLGVSQVPGANSSLANTANSQINAVVLRRLEAFQKFAEITDLNKSDYKHQVRAHFGFEPSDLNSDYCTYIGGFEDIVNISDVENTTSIQSGALTGKGVSAGNSRNFSFKVNEHGMIMTICYVLPLVDYANLFIERYCTHLNRYDFPIPEFDSIGFEPVRLFDVYNQYGNALLTSSVTNGSDSANILGYLPRYWSYKTKLDVAFTPFYNGNNKTYNLNFSSYIIPFDYERLRTCVAAGTTYKAFKCVPSVTDRLFSQAYGGNVENSPFVVTFYDKVSAMLPLSVSGLPY